MAKYNRDLIDSEKFFILTPISTNRQTYFGWVLTVKKYLKQCNLDDILYWVDASEMPKHVFKKKARLFFQVMRKTMVECIYKTFVRRTKYLGDFGRIFTMFCR